MEIKMFGDYDIFRTNTNAEKRLKYILTDTIEPSSTQPRRIFDNKSLEDLMASIREIGIIQPITVRYTGNGKYELIAGERRLRAAKNLQLQFVPCIVTNVNDEDSAIMTLTENLQRKDLNCFEEAEGIRQLIEVFGITQDEAAIRIGKSQSSVANKLRILKLPERVKDYIIVNGLTERHARALLAAGSEDLMMAAAVTAVKLKMTVAQLESYIEKNRLKTRPQKSRERGFCRDLRLYTNTINRAVKLMRESGIKSASEKTEDDKAIIYKITIYK